MRLRESAERHARHAAGRARPFGCRIARFDLDNIVVRLPALRRPVPPEALARSDIELELDVVAGVVENELRGGFRDLLIPVDRFAMELDPAVTADPSRAAEVGYRSLVSA